jgi:WD40 repeat protein
MVSIKHSLTIQTGESELFSVRWSPDDLLLAAASSDGTVKILSKDGDSINALPCYRNLAYPVTSVRWRPSGGKTRNIVLSATCDGGMYHYHVSSGKIIHFSQISAGILSLDYSEDGQFYAIGCDDSSIQVFDENTKTTIASFNEECGLHHTSRVMCLKWSSRSTFWTGGWDKMVILWDIRTKKSIRHLNDLKLCGEAIDFVDNRMITGQYEIENQVKMWDLRTFGLVKCATVGSSGNKCLVYSVKAGNNSLAVSGSGRNSVFFLDKELELIGIVAGVDKPSYSLDFDRSKERLAVSSGDGSVRVFSI